MRILQGCGLFMGRSLAKETVVIIMYMLFTYLQGSLLLDQQQMISSAVGDPSFYPDQTTPLEQSFSLTPPYMPYSQDHTPYDENQTPSNYFSQLGSVNERTMIGQELNGSQTYPATHNNSMPSSYDHMTYASDVTTPTYDHMTPASAVPGNYGMPQAVSSRPLPLVLTQSTGPYVTTQTTPTTSGNHSTVPTNQILSMNGHVTHFCSQSSTPSPPVELHPLSFASSSNSINTVSNNYPNQNASSPDFMRFVDTNEPVVFQPLSSQAPSHVKQSVVTETRARYSGATPMHMSGVGGHREAGPMRGHTPRSAGSHDSDAEAASQSISQWSQWLKSGAPEPVC